MNVERIKELSVLLRSPEQWPEGFVWDFGSHDGCAMGLFSRIWFDNQLVTTKALKDALGITHDLARNIFLYGQLVEPTYEERLGIEDRAITPEDIADCLDMVRLSRV
jgi:hypothetical protein